MFKYQACNAIVKIHVYNKIFFLSTLLDIKSNFKNTQLTKNLVLFCCRDNPKKNGITFGQIGPRVPSGLILQALILPVIPNYCSVDQNCPPSILQIVNIFQHLNINGLFLLFFMEIYFILLLG